MGRERGERWRYIGGEEKWGSEKLKMSGMGLWIMENESEGTWW